MKCLTYFLLSACLICFSKSSSGNADPAGHKIVILAGTKSHPSGFHEYIKSARLIKAILEKQKSSNLTVVIYNDWPQNPHDLDDASVIVSISDGRDGQLYKDAAHLVPERIPIIEQQMDRGCGLVTIHFSTFSPDEYGAKILEWNGGYFDWQDETGERNWYSGILNIETEVFPAMPVHPVCRGVKPFKIDEEFYYNIRFPENTSGWNLILTVPQLNSDKPDGNVVAWALERKNGGRGFGTTMGHRYSNWANKDFRRLILNGIVWAAGLEVPPGGVKSTFYTDRKVTKLLFKKNRKALILTGDNIEAHEWEKTTAALQDIFKNSPFHIDVSTNIEDLGQYNLHDYDLLILNYCNWNHPHPLSNPAKKSFTDYLFSGGGLMILHFSNGAFNFSLPNAPESDWPEYRKICRRVWDHHSNSAHDAYGTFAVKIHPSKHPITKRLKGFETTDELYYNQKGTEPIDTLAFAVSKNTGKAEPLAWQYQYGEGLVFQTVLGHNARAYSSEGFRQLLLQAARRVSKKVK